MASRRNAVPWGSFLAVLGLVIVLPTLIDWGLAARWPGLVTALHYFVSTVYAITALMIVWEACAARRDAAPEVCDEAALPPLPRCTAIVAAYLPNEQDIILETVAHMLSKVGGATADFEMILAYNTPERLPIEDVLAAVADRDPRLRLLRVEGSRSKAENINAALEEAQGEIVGVYDADHAPHADCFHRAWRWLGQGYDMVQGRCVIRNGGDNWLTRLIAVEFDSIYTLSHQGRSRLSRTAIFGGSNGYWRLQSLRSAGMNPAMLTEDIDCSVRSLLAGRKLAHDRSIISEELAPMQARHWLFQRKRWAQGWFEVTLCHLRGLMQTPYLNPLQKFFWFYLLAWREVYPFLALQVFSLMLTAVLRGQSIHWFGNWYFLATSIITLASGPLMIALTFLWAGPRRMRARKRWYFSYLVLSLFYTAAKTLITLVAQLSHVIRDRAWVTTPRAAPPPPSGPAS